MSKTLAVATLSMLALIAGYEVNKAQVSAKRDETRQFMIGILTADGTFVSFAQSATGGWWPKPRQPACQ